MLDTDEFAAYEAWKLKRLEGAQDITVQAYNAEMESLALAWEDGVKSLYKAVESLDPLQDRPLADVRDEVLANSPHRRKGMRGHRGTDPQLPTASTRLTSD